MKKKKKERKTLKVWLNMSWGDLGEVAGGESVLEDLLNTSMTCSKNK